MFIESITSILLIVVKTWTKYKMCIHKVYTNYCDWNWFTISFIEFRNFANWITCQYIYNLFLLYLRTYMMTSWNENILCISCHFEGYPPVSSGAQSQVTSNGNFSYFFGVSLNYWKYTPVHELQLQRFFLTIKLLTFTAAYHKLCTVIMFYTY